MGLGVLRGARWLDTLGRREQSNEKCKQDCEVCRTNKKLIKAIDQWFAKL